MSTLETISKELSAAICGSSCLDYPLPSFVSGSTSIIRYHCCTEKAVKVFSCTESGLVRRNRFHLGDLRGDLGDPCRFVALAAVGHRREERRVGFDEHAIERDLRENVADGLRFGEGDIAGEGDQEAEIHGAAGVGPLAGEAVQDAAERGGRPLRFEHCERVVPGVGGV